MNELAQVGAPPVAPAAPERAAPADAGEPEVQARRVQSVRISPGRWAFAWASLGAVLAWVAPADLRWWTLLAFNALLLGGIWLEGAVLRRRPVHVRRRLQGRLAKGAPQRVELAVHNPGPWRLRLRLRDDAPADGDAHPPEHRLVLDGHGRARCHYTLVPGERGEARFGALYVRSQGPLGLGAVTWQLDARKTVRVYPPAAIGRRGGLSGPRNRLGEVRMRTRRRARGRGEFEMLREYVTGDEIRDVDWKATAKRGRPVTRVYQQERSQYLWLILDASRSMAVRLEEKAPDTAADDTADTQHPRPPRVRMDAALDAALRLARRALAAGDQVGAIVYGDGLYGLVPPGRGQAHYRRLLDGLYGAQARQTHLDVRGLVALLEQRARRRALLVFFTDLEQEGHVAPLLEHAPLLRRRHLPVCVSLADATAGAHADRGAEEPAQVYVRAAAVDVLQDRRRLQAELDKRGVDVVEAEAAALADAAVAKYLEIKAAQRL